MLIVLIFISNRKSKCNCSSYSFVSYLSELDYMYIMHQIHLFYTLCIRRKTDVVKWYNYSYHNKLNSNFIFNFLECMYDRLRNKWVKRYCSFFSTDVMALNLTFYHDNVSWRKAADFCSKHNGFMESNASLVMKTIVDNNIKDVWFGKYEVYSQWAYIRGEYWYT